VQSLARLNRILSLSNLYCSFLSLYALTSNSGQQEWSTPCHQWRPIRNGHRDLFCLLWVVFFGLQAAPILRMSVTLPLVHSPGCCFLYIWGYLWLTAYECWQFRWEWSPCISVFRAVPSAICSVLFLHSVTFGFDNTFKFTSALSLTETPDSPTRRLHCYKNISI
jgi:hypothetical protein